MTYKEFTNILASSDKVSLSDKLDELFSPVELYDFIIRVNNYDIVLDCLKHPAVSSEMLEKLCNRWPFNKDIFCIETVKDRKVYSYQLIDYVSSNGNSNTWTFLLNQMVDGIITSNQIIIMWSNCSVYYKSLMSNWGEDCSIPIIIPDCLLVEFYLNNVFVAENSKFVDEYFGDMEKFRSVVACYVAYDNLDEAERLLKSPLSWLISLAEVRFNISKA